jgi:hypothetical protein
MRDSAKQRGKTKETEGKIGKYGYRGNVDIDGEKTRRKERECGKTGGRMKV